MEEAKKTKQMNQLTKRRQSILEAVDCASVPMDAGAVFHKLEKKVNLATIYRGLQYLETHNYIRGFTLNCDKYGTVRFYHRISEPHIHYFHCKHCHRFFSYTDCFIDKLREEIKNEYRFNISHHVLYFIGACESCENALKNENK